jgi:hypothetical protein
MSRTRLGKIARLPASIREELNTRLLNGESGPKLIAWLHSLPEVLTVLDEHFAESPITPQNLSEWRQGGYQEWLLRRERVEETKILAKYALQLAQASGASVSDGAAAILGGKILEAAENLSESSEGTETLIGLSVGISKLRDSDSKLLRARVAERNAEQKDRQLDLDEKKFQRTTAELFIKWAAKPEAVAIIGSGDTKAVQMDKLVQLFFGTDPSLSNQSPVPDGDDQVPTSSAALSR